MFDINVSQDQLSYAKEQVSRFNFGNRGYGDGTFMQQLTGIIGQTVLADLTNQPRPSGINGFDGGKDFIINGKSIDIKTMSRTCAVRNYFVHNFIGYQKKYPVDYYIFCSLNTRTNILTVCGFVDKKTLFERAIFFPKGSIRTRSDGSSFKTFAPLYEIKQTELESISCIQDIFQKIS